MRALSSGSEAAAATQIDSTPRRSARGRALESAPPEDKESICQTSARYFHRGAAKTTFGLLLSSSQHSQVYALDVRNYGGRSLMYSPPLQTPARIALTTPLNGHPQIAIKLNLTLTDTSSVFLIVHCE